MPALDYLRVHEPDNLRPVGREYRLRDHESLSIGDNGWYWHSKGIGSRSAIDFLTDVRGYDLVEAVCMVLGESPHGRLHMPGKNLRSKPVPPVPTATDEAKRPPFVLPLRHKDNKRVIAYLQSRGIDRDLIMDCISRGVLFESKYYHNCVFLGKDEHGRTKFAAMRSTTNNFMRDADGSKKKYGFVIPPDNQNTTAAALYESPIDCLSHQTLCKQASGWDTDFYESQRADILLHRAAKKYFDSLGLKKLPTISELKQEYATLAAEKKKLYSGYRSAKDSARELAVAKDNSARILGITSGEQDRDVSRQHQRHSAPDR